mmetsp:Transcript_21655/g.49312  ORF Transcript_21655/g.49312 Transcript_21655/m.49312 type:complete len:177 (+) Transcript_21655:97-627(+)
MGGLLSLFWGKECDILMIGLDNAGKTTILYKLNVDEVVATAPTVGFNVEQVKSGSATFTVWDCGGQKKIRHLWRQYYARAQGIIFVVDANDHERLGEAKEELQGVLGEDAVQDTVVLVLANKQDMPTSLKEEALGEALSLGTVKQKLRLQLACALDGQGLSDGLDWLSREVRAAAK